MPIAFLIAIAVYVALFVWLERRMASPFSAAMAIALSQFALVNVDYVLSGKRGFGTAAASTLILFVSWSAVAAVYAWLRSQSDSSQEHNTKPIVSDNMRRRLNECVEAGWLAGQSYAAGENPYGSSGVAGAGWDAAG